MTEKEFQPLISIIIPVYNGENYLAEAIESALKQTYKEIEILVVDDGSTDKTASIASAYKDKIIYIKKENGGVASALNLGIERAQGDYISWLSHDDLYQSEKIRMQVRYLKNLEEAKRERTIIYTNYAEMNDKYDIYNHSQLERKFKVNKLNHPLFALYKGFVNGCTLFIPKKVLLDEGLFNETLRYSQDFVMWQKIFPKYDLVFLEDETVISRKHDNQGGEDYNKRRFEEYAKLWIGIGKNTPIKMMQEISGSELKFYEEILKNMRSMKVFEAAHYYEKLIDTYHEHNTSKLKTLMTKVLHRVFLLLPYYRENVELKEELRLTNERLERMIEKTIKTNIVKN